MKNPHLIKSEVFFTYYNLFEYRVGWSLRIRFLHLALHFYYKDKENKPNHQI